MAIRLRNLFEQELASSKNLWLLGSTARPLLYLFLGILLVSSAVAHCGLRLAGIKKDWRESGYEDTFVAILVALGTLNQSWSIEFCWCEHLWSVIFIYLAGELEFTKSWFTQSQTFGVGFASPNQRYVMTSWGDCWQVSPKESAHLPLRRTAYADLLAASPSWGHCSHWTLPWKRWWPLVAKNIEIIWNHTLSETMLTFKPFLLNLYSKVDFSCQCTAKTRSSLKFCERKVLLAKMSVSASRNLYRTTRKVYGFHDLVSVMRQFTSGRGLIFWWPFLVSFVCQN